jgi:hypothetical protein
VPKTGTASATFNIPAASGRPIYAAFQAAIKRATADLKGLATLLGVLAGVVAAYYAFEEKLKLHEPWPAAICGGALLAFVLLFWLPEVREQLKLQRLRINGIRGRIIDPKYFRIAPYETDDAEFFRRPDAAATDVCRWIEASSHSVLYLSGQSGVGKSSLINAALVPSMTARKWIVLTLRPHHSPLNEIAAALMRPSAVWRRPPTTPFRLRDLIEQAGERVQRDGKRLLLVIDQFEEALILCGNETREALSSLLRDLAEQPVSGVKVLLSVRAEYLNDLPVLGLRPPAFGYGENAFEVRPFSRADAQAFIEKSGLDLAPGLLEKVLEEASEIEDMPDRVRPIVLNMFGLAVAPFPGSLPKGVIAGRLLSGYVERSLKRSATQDWAVQVLRPLVTDAGTKRALTTEQIAEEAGAAPLVARGCLIALANDGLVRLLHGTPERWEVAHDFVARLLQPLLRSWERSAWERSRPYLVPVPLVVWLFAIVGLIVFYPALHDEYILWQLRTVGLVPGASTNAGGTVVQNNTPIKDVAHFWRVTSLLQDLSNPVVRLEIHNEGLTALTGMPALPTLTSLDLSESQLASLQGMPVLPALASLNLRLTPLASLRGMPTLPALTSLNLSVIPLASLQGMPTLPALTSLNLSGTPLASLEGMPTLPALTSLNLSGTIRLASLEGMPALPALTSLDLSATRLASLEGMPALPALTSLNLSDIHLATLQGMPALPQLKTINLSGNPSIDLSYLTELPTIEKVLIDEGQVNQSTIPSAIKLNLDIKPIMRYPFP